MLDAVPAPERRRKDFPDLEEHLSVGADGYGLCRAAPLVNADETTGNHVTLQ
jgi:hypothetical protein